MDKICNTHRIVLHWACMTAVTTVNTVVLVLLEYHLLVALIGVVLFGGLAHGSPSACIACAFEDAYLDELWGDG